MLRHAHICCKEHYKLTFGSISITKSAAVQGLLHTCIMHSYRLATRPYSRNSAKKIGLKLMQEETAYTTTF